MNFDRKHPSHTVSQKWWSNTRKKKRKAQVSCLRPHISNLTSQVSLLKFQISSLTSQVSRLRIYDVRPTNNDLGRIRLMITIDDLQPTTYNLRPTTIKQAGRQGRQERETGQAGSQNKHSQVFCPARREKKKRKSSYAACRLACLPGWLLACLLA